MDAHANEYVAAVAGMADTYGQAKTFLPEVGDTVTGITAGRRWMGEVMTAEPGRLAIEVSGAWIVVPSADLIEIVRKAGA